MEDWSVDAARVVIARDYLFPSRMCGSYISKLRRTLLMAGIKGNGQTVRKYKIFAEFHLTIEWLIDTKSEEFCGS